MDFSVSNFFEEIVFNEIRLLAMSDGEYGSKSPDFWQDVACLALNQLPPRYVRFMVDANFYMTPNERATIGVNVKAAVKRAVQIASKPRQA